jgi:hypothetical protein
VDHTDGYILVGSDGRERFVDATAPNLGGHLDPRLTSLLDDGGVHDLHHPQQPNWTIADALASISWILGTNVGASGSGGGPGCAAPPSSFRQPSSASPWHWARARAPTSRR